MKLFGEFVCFNNLFMKDIAKGFCFNLLYSLTMVSCRKKDFTTGLKEHVIGLLAEVDSGVLHFHCG